MIMKVWSLDFREYLAAVDDILARVVGDWIKVNRIGFGILAALAGSDDPFKEFRDTLSVGTLDGQYVWVVGSGEIGRSHGRVVFECSHGYSRLENSETFASLHSKHNLVTQEESSGSQYISLKT